MQHEGYQTLDTCDQGEKPDQMISVQLAEATRPCPAQEDQFLQELLVAYLVGQG